MARIARNPTLAAVWFLVPSVAAGILAVAACDLAAQSMSTGRGSGVEHIDAIKLTFARPAYLPAPVDNRQSAEKIALGERLFNDPALSANGKVSCATCHDRRLGFTDGEARGQGVTSRRLKRHTPTLWNLAWAPLLFWDGRAASLEDQVRGPIEHPDEMGEEIERVVARLATADDYKAAFARAFPDEPTPSARTLAMALAVYERTLVSPPTDFDRWVAGDTAALTTAQVRGFALFTGKGRCSSCHSGFAFTDHGFYDIGLPSNDPGRGPILGVSAANSSFKTPTLRELVWSAPYMHDGSLATLEEVVRHYERGGVRRPTRAKDLPASLRLSDRERADLVAFLESLSSPQPPKPSTEAWVATPAAAAPGTPSATATTTVSQIDKLFSPTRVRVGRDLPLTVLNDDTRTHNVRVYDRRLDFNSGAQEPGETVVVRFPEAGHYEAFCGIHPTMRLAIEVE